MQSCVDFSNGFSGGSSRQKPAAFCPPENRPFFWLLEAQKPAASLGKGQTGIVDGDRYGQNSMPMACLFDPSPAACASVSIMCVRLTDCGFILK